MKVCLHANSTNHMPSIIKMAIKFTRFIKCSSNVVKSVVHELRKIYKLHSLNFTLSSTNSCTVAKNSNYNKLPFIDVLRILFNENWKLQSSDGQLTAYPKWVSMMSRYTKIQPEVNPNDPHEGSFTLSQKEDESGNIYKRVRTRVTAFAWLNTSVK